VSVAAITWAWKQHIAPAAKKLVLVAISDYANDEGEAWPTIKPGGDPTRGLAAKTGLSERSVRCWIDALESEGLLSKMRRQRRPDGSLGSWVYQLHLDRSPPSPPVDKSRESVDNSGPSGSLLPVAADCLRQPTATPSGSPLQPLAAAHCRADPSVHPSIHPSSSGRSTRTDTQSYPQADDDADIRFAEIITHLVNERTTKFPPKSNPTAYRASIARQITRDFGTMIRDYLAGHPDTPVDLAARRLALDLP
jgi:hypothetical protein